MTRRTSRPAVRGPVFLRIEGDQGRVMAKQMLGHFGPARMTLEAGGEVFVCECAVMQFGKIPAGAEIEIRQITPLHKPEEVKL